LARVRAGRRGRVPFVLVTTGRPLDHVANIPYVAAEGTPGETAVAVAGAGARLQVPT